MRQAPIAGTRDSESTLTLTPMVNAHAEQDRRREIQVPTATNGNALRNTRCRGDDRCYFRISLIGKGGKLTTHQHSSAPKPGRLSPSRSRFSCVSMCRSSHVNSNNSIPSRCSMKFEIELDMFSKRLTLRLETHDESIGRLYRRHGCVAVDGIGHLSSGTTPPHTKGLKAHAYPHTHRASLAPLVATGLMP
jgi:hypothetical protein